MAKINASSQTDRLSSDTTRHNTIQHDTIRHDTTRHHKTQNFFFTFRMKQSLIHIRMKQSLVWIGWNKIWYRMKQNLDLRWKKSFCVLWCCVVSFHKTHVSCRINWYDTTHVSCRVILIRHDTFGQSSDQSYLVDLLLICEFCTYATECNTMLL